MARSSAYREGDSKRGRWPEARRSDDRRGDSDDGPEDRQGRGDWKSKEWSRTWSDRPDRSDRSAGWSKDSPRWNGGRWSRAWNEPKPWSKSWSRDWSGDEDEHDEVSGRDLKIDPEACGVKLTPRSKDQGAERRPLTISRRERSPPRRVRATSCSESEDEIAAEVMPTPQKRTVRDLASNRAKRAVERPPLEATTRSDQRRGPPLEGSSRRPRSRSPRRRVRRRVPCGRMASAMGRESSAASMESVGSSVIKPGGAPTKRAALAKPAAPAKTVAPARRAAPVEATRDPTPEDEASDSDAHLALPVEPLNDDTVPGPVRAGTPAKVDEMRQRRRVHAAEAAKFAARPACAKSMPSPAVAQKLSAKPQVHAEKNRGKDVSVKEQLPPEAKGRRKSSLRNERRGATSEEQAEDRGPQQQTVAVALRPAKSKQKTAAPAATGVATNAPATRQRSNAEEDEGPPPGDWSQGAPDVMSKSEQKEFEAKVLNQLRTLSVAVADAELVRDFICCLVQTNKHAKDMIKELGFLEQEAEPFVAWVQACKEGILSRSKDAAKAQLRAQLTPVTRSDVPAQWPGVAPVVTAATSSARAASTRVSAPKRARSPLSAPPGRLSVSEPREAAPSSPSRRSTKKEYVVVTKRLVLQPSSAGTVQPNAAKTHVAKTIVKSRTQATFRQRSRSRSAASSSSSSSQALAAQASAKPATAEASADDKRLDLLAKMTTKLQEILAKLQDTTMDDPKREKLQALAQTIQASMTKMSAQDEEAWPEA